MASGLIQLTHGEFDIDDSALVPLTKACLVGVGSGRTIVHLVGTLATGGIKCSIGTTSVICGNVQHLSLKTDASYVGNALTLEASAAMIFQMTKLFDGVRIYAPGTSTIDHTAGSVGLYIHVTGADGVITDCQFGQMVVHGYEKGVYILLDGTSTSYFNSSGWDGLYNTGSEWGIYIQNDTVTTTSSFAGNIFSRTWVSDWAGYMQDSLIVTSTTSKGMKQCVWNVNMMDRSSAGAAIRLNSDSNNNVFRGFFLADQVIDQGNDNQFFPVGEIADCGSIISGDNRSSVKSLTASALSGTNPVATVWENPTNDYILIDKVDTRISTKTDAACTADIDVVSLLDVENCEDVWVDGGTGHTTISLSSLNKVGTYCNKITIDTGFAAHGADTLIATEATAATLDCSTHVGLLAWILCDHHVHAGDLQFLLDEHASCASPDQILSVPELVADTWTRVFIPYTTAPTAADRNAIISVGLRYHSYLGSSTLHDGLIIYIDDLQSVPTDDDFGNNLDIGTAATIFSSLSTTLVPIYCGPPGQYAEAVVFYPSADTTGLAGKMYVHYTGI